MKKSISITLLCVLLFCLCSCGINEEEAIGTWSGIYTYERNTLSVAFVLDDDGDYSKAIYKNGKFSSSESGTWEIKKGKVILREKGSKSWTEYKYKDGALVNNGHKFYKK